VSEPLVIVGNGMAAARLVDEQLTRCALDRHTIAVIGDEPRLVGKGCRPVVHAAKLWSLHNRPQTELSAPR